MAEINPPNYLENGCITAQQDRLLWGSIICAEGVKNAGGVGTDLRAGSVTSQPLTILVSAGSAFISGDVVANQGIYHVFSDSSVLLNLAAPDPTDSRIDLIVARVYDSQYFGTEDRWALEVVTGDPSPSPSIPDAPPNSLELAMVRVDPGLVFTSPGIITDFRTQFEICQPPQPIIQSGSLLIQAIDGVGSQTVTFPTPFPGNPNVVATPTSSAGATTVATATVSSITSTSVEIYMRRNTQTETRIHWVAVYMPGT